jgi:ABC-type oligopeptide transport system ATPase subunit
MTTEENKSLLEATNLIKSYAPEAGLLGIFGVSGERIPALNGVSLRIEEGETYGLTGESGSGKSALAKVLAGIEKTDRGKVMFMGQYVTGEDRAKWQGRLRYVSDESYSGLSPADPKNRLDNLLYSLSDKFGSGNGRSENRALANDLIRRVGLDQDDLKRWPHQISGGQRQRFAIARALLVKPKLIICDEPVSNLDLEYRTQMLNLLKQMGKQYNIAFLFISHNPSEVRYFTGTGRVGVMFAGRLMEEIPGRTLFDKAVHPYTKTLLSANEAPAPVPASAFDANRVFAKTEQAESDAAKYQTIESTASELGTTASISQLWAANKRGCPYYTWCPERFERCAEETPELITVTRYRNESGEDLALPAAKVDPKHKAACFHYIEQT